MRNRLSLIGLLILLLAPQVLGTGLYTSIAPHQDFSLSEGEVYHSQSIDSFEQTVNNETLHYPDTFKRTYLATSGSSDFPPVVEGNYTNTWELDDVYFSANYLHNITLWFEPNGIMSYGIANYTIVANCLAGSAYLAYWNGADWVDTGTYLTSTMTAYSWQVDMSGNATLGISIRLDGFSGSTWVSCDYALIELWAMTTTSNEGFAESFSNVNDWVLASPATGVISTNGDVGNFTADAGVSTAYFYQEIETANLYGFYYEVRMSNWDNIAVAKLQFYDGASYYDLVTFSSLGTFKGVITSAYADTVERIVLYITPNVETDSCGILPDYLRISHSYEMGLMHDGSTTNGFSLAYGTGTATSDGNKVSINGVFNFVPDTTATLAKIDVDYYPFLEVSISNLVGSWTLYAWDGNSVQTLVQSASYATGTFRYNLDTILADDELYYFRFYPSASGSLSIGHVGIYSIANFSSFSSMASNEYLYVDSGALYWERTTSSTMYAYYQTNALSISTPYDTWNCSVTSNVHFGFDYYNGAWSANPIGVATGSLSGTVTRFRIISDGDITVSAIQFYYIPPQWHLVSSVDIYFVLPQWNIVNIVTVLFTVPISQVTISLFLMVLGAMMIPSSGAFLVWGGRKNMSRDKLFLVLIIFFIGWGLFLGGIL